MEESELLEPFELHYSDLILLSSPPTNDSVSSEELERLEAVKRTILETLGPEGPGLLSITGVPSTSLLRRNLLPLARKLALLDHGRRKLILKNHNLGSDVPLKNPDRIVSSFAMHLKYAEAQEHNNLADKLNNDDPHGSDSEVECEDNEFKNLAGRFKELGYCMMELGLRVAKICDKAIGGQELERSLMESGTAKGRLIHYHSFLDNLVIENSCGKKASSKKVADFRQKQEVCLRSKLKELKGTNLVGNGNERGPCGNQGNLWQQWHYDYGIFTVLTAPMFRLSESIAADQECPCPDGNSCLQVFDSNRNRVLRVKSSPESFIVQVGESADILSKGKLRSTLHCVSRPEKLGTLSRDTFVVFLQPSWNKTFSISDYAIGHSGLGANLEGNSSTEHELDELAKRIREIVPPLSSRLKDGMTFAEFSRETTKQYYGGRGLQSNS
ncbi:hypothetical protein Tsubulata_046857 [Turnera subulata]|uniref:Isopenicillin N synthase-like Fe(2+) 2OG dioxygenase domain-containing protein n=1 Tax=Turnera subulata TaxID=218843 RepID=A0A9Q0FXL3_9ROSI|nr:hypothetical protein Tsubulata_046857 [Turnera subulata]